MRAGVIRGEGGVWGAEEVEEGPVPVVAWEDRWREALAVESE